MRFEKLIFIVLPLSELQNFKQVKRISNKSAKIGGNNGNFVCNQCGKEYSAKWNLKQHMELHIGKYRYRCEKCGKGFNSTTNYKQHMRGHEGLRYHCEYCSKPFKSLQAYRKHTLNHAR